jgi:heat shock protein HtpX
MATIFGMGGSFISLAMSKWIAKRATGAEVIDRLRSHVEAWLLQTVERQAKQAGIGMPRWPCIRLRRSMPSPRV